MRLIRIVVDAFQCIAHAEVELTPGLNVLYGPNDLGKSSLASAVRSVLLLPHGSSAHEELLSWHSGDAPRVALTFSTEAQKIWRVSKSFGAGSAGSSLLEFSKDGSSFSTDATAREVDAKVRDLLRWGISLPGGRGAGHGLPDSFLANVLLAEQLDVPAVLTKGLENDRHESGRKRLNEALQALAQDPLFKRILDVAVEQVGIAFTSTGQLKRGQKSPFTSIAAEIRSLESQKQALQSQLNATVSAEETLQILNGELDELSALASEADSHLAAVREAHGRAVARAAVEEELRAAQADRDAIRSELAELAEAERAVAALGELVAVAEAALAERTQAAGEAARLRDEAEARLQEVIAEQGAQARQLAVQELENERLKAIGRRDSLLRRVAAAETALQRVQEEAAAQEALASINARVAAAEGALAECAAAERTAREDLDRQGVLETVARLRDARARLEAAETALAQARLDHEAAAKRHDEADRLQQQIGALHVPDDDRVRQLAELARQRDLAEARLSVGLSVALTPLADVRLRVAADGAAPAEHAGREPLVVEAQRSVALRVDELLDVTITAGEATAREEAERLRARWGAEALPVLEAAAVPSLAALEELCRRAGDLQKQLAERRGDVETLERRAAGLEQRAVGIEGLRQRVADLDSALAGRASEALATELGDLGDAWETEIERRRSAAEEAARNATRQLDGARERLGAMKTEQAGSETACRQAAAATAQAMAQFPEGVETLLVDGRRELAQLDVSLADLAARIDAMSHQAEDELTEAQRNRDAAVKQLDAANEAVRDGQVDRDARRVELAQAAGSVEQRRRQAERLDLAAAEERVEALALRLDGLPHPAIAAGEAEVATAEERLRRACGAIDDKRGEIHRAQGALEQVGGAVVREQLEDVERALQLARDRQAQTEIEFRAWRLLEDTLREAENSEGAHLGRALAGPVAQRFGALTGGRYGQIAIGRDLELARDCVEAAGQLRPYDLLSAGTQDQLATIFRLCIAEQLGTFIVLDDHLSQSDPDRIRWFRDRLLEAAERIQIVLLTCRPEDYLLADEFPGGDEIVRDSGTLRAVNLGRAIQRYPFSGAPTFPVAASVP